MVGRMATELHPALVHPGFQLNIETNVNLSSGNTIPLHPVQEAQMLTSSDLKYIPWLNKHPSF